MAAKIIVPDIGDFENVEIIEILVKSGDTIKKNDPVVTLESDKSSVEVPSPFTGKISSLEVKIGDKVSKGSVLAVIESEEVKTSAKPIKEIKEKIKPLVLKKEIFKKEEILPETEKIIKEAESSVIQKPKKEEEKKVYARPNGADIDPIETKEWLDSLDANPPDRIPAYKISKVSNLILEKSNSSNIITNIKDKVATIRFCSKAIKKGRSNRFIIFPI